MASSKSPAIWHGQRAVVERLGKFAVRDFARADEDYALISRVTDEYRASEALVLPVEAQAAFVAPTSRAWLNAADIPLSLSCPTDSCPRIVDTDDRGDAADVHAPRLPEALQAGSALRRS